MQDTKKIFLRFRHGNKLEISSNIQNEILKFLKKRKTLTSKEIFRTEIKDIADGSGLGIHPNSTWLSAIREVYQGVIEKDLSKDIEKIILLIFVNLCKFKNCGKAWISIREIILNNIDQMVDLSRLDSRLLDYKKIKKDKDGQHYYYQNKEKIFITGAKTFEEERFNLISDDLLNAYGKLNKILKFISLVFISIDSQKNNEDYPDRVKCLLVDNDGDSAYLHWKWHMRTPEESKFFPWKPKNFLCDPEWLGMDVIARLKTGREYNISDVERASSIENFHEKFNSYNFVYSVALETNLFLCSDNEFEIYFNFKGRPIRWSEGNGKFFPNITIGVKDANDCREEIRLVNQFISAMIYDTGVKIKKIAGVSGPKNYSPGIRQPRIYGGYGMDGKYAQLIEPKSSSKMEIALALYKEAENSGSPLYSFLSFYKILQLQYKGLKVKNWINNNISRVRVAELDKWVQSALKKKPSVGDYLYFDGRCAVAHIEEVMKGNSVNPEDLDDYRRIDNDVYIVRELAKLIIDEIKKE